MAVHLPALMALAAGAPPKVAIIGGGIAGLSCASRLRALGCDATVFDTGKRAPGGRASSRPILVRGAARPELWDHAAQFFTATGEFAREVRDWEAAGVVSRWRGDGLGRLAAGGAFAPFGDDGVERWIGATSMGDVAAHLARGCARIEQDVWISPAGGARYDARAAVWRLRASGEDAGSFEYLVVAHNGKCAERLMGSTPAEHVARLLRARFAPALRGGGGGAGAGGDVLTLGAQYSLFFALPAGAVPHAALAGAVVEGSERLAFLTCHGRKRPQTAAAALPAGTEAWTAISTAAFGAAHKAPQEALPAALVERVTRELLEAVAHATGATRPLQPAQTRLQLWGAGVPVNVWRSDDGARCLLEGAHRVGVCGDWLAAPSVQGAWESGRELADALAAAIARGSGAPPPVDIGLRGRFVSAAAAAAERAGGVAASSSEMVSRGLFVDGAQPQGAAGGPARRAAAGRAPAPAGRAPAPASGGAAPAARGGPPRGASGGARASGAPVYAGNLPFSATDDDLRAVALEACGGDATQIVRVSVPRDRESGKGRGFGFVEMASADAAARLVSAAAGAQLGGRPVRFELRR